MLSACAELKEMKSGLAELKPEPGPGAAIVTENIFKKEPPRPNEGSLWPGDTSNNLLFGDTKARAVGDVVTVILEESFASSTSATTETTRDSSISASTGQLLGLPSNLGINNFLGSGNQFDPNINATFDRTNDNEGTTTRNGSMTGRITATIKEVKPNGTLVIEGRRTVQVNNEEQIMIMTGVVRRVDISFSNTISSTLIADARIMLTGEGVVADEQRVGWLSRLLGKVWPF